MAGTAKKITISILRISSQSFFFLVAVLGLFGIAMTGFIYPFFFCPASPAACAGCPIWVIEHGTIDIVKGVDAGYYMLLYLAGMFVAIGAVVGRSFCGWACPVGTLQDIFTALDRKLTKDRNIYILAGSALTMLLVGTFVPSIMRENDIELKYYMWTGYVGALGAFLGALSGIMFIKRKKTVVPSFVILGIGIIFWVINIIARALSYGSSPLASIELMGFLGLMFSVIGLIGIIRLYLHEKAPKVKRGGRFDWSLRLVKVGILVLIAPTSWFFDTLFFTDFDPIGGITATLPELLLNPTGWSGNQFFWIKGIFVVGVIALVAFVDRGWCRYLCPIGAMYGPTNKFSMTDIEFHRKECINCQLCIRECPMAINPKEDKRDPECIRCGRCMKVCPTRAQRFVFFNRSLRGVFGR
ncbi:MAG: 4Fe-4S binding protein [Thermoplasmatota archaeon]